MYDIQSKCMKENKIMSYNIREKTVQMNISQKRISSKLTLSNNSLRVVTEKCSCLTLLYCWHSRIIWTTVHSYRKGIVVVLLVGEGTDVWGGCNQCWWVLSIGRRRLSSSLWAITGAEVIRRRRH